MTKNLRFGLILLVGLGVVAVPGALPGWTSPPLPHRHDRDKEHHRHDRGRHEHERHDRGLHRGWDRDREGHYRFNTYDRRAAEDYYRRHRDYRWFRQRAPRGFAFAYGRVIEPRYRRYCHRVPAMMLREMPPPPRGLRYFLFGGRVVLVDGGYRLHDFIQLNFAFGR